MVTVAAKTNTNSERITEIKVNDKEYFNKVDDHYDKLIESVNELKVLINKK